MHLLVLGIQVGNLSTPFIAVFFYYVLSSRMPGVLAERNHTLTQLCRACRRCFPVFSRCWCRTTEVGLRA